MMLKGAGRRPIFRHGALILMAVTLLDGVTALARPATAVQVSAPPTIAGCPILPADNIWNARVDNLPVHSQSDAYIRSMGLTGRLKADFGAGLYEGGPIGIPYTTVPGSQPRVPIQFEYADESDPGPYPIPPDAPIEGGPNGTGDRHVLVVDRDNCRLYEVFDARQRADGSWQAGSGAVFDLRSNALRPDGWTSADAAGLPVLPGVVRYDEVAAGEISHALRFTAVVTQRAYVWPARHFASSRTDPNLPPMGIRVRLKANVDISRYSQSNQVILRALKTYGMMLADNGSNWFVSGAPDERWNNDDLQALRGITGNDFEVVDASSLMLDPNSGQVRGVQPAPTPVSTFAPTPLPPTSETRSIFVPTVRNAHTDRAIGGLWRTGLQVLNLDAGKAANVQIRYVYSDGSTAAQTPPTAIPAGKSQTYFGATIGVAEGFDGAAMVTADTPIAVIANQLAQDTGLSGSFNGVATPSTRMFVPIAPRNAEGANTSLHLQNAGTSVASSVRVSFYRLDATTSVHTRSLPAPIAPGASYALQLAGVQELGDNFRGSAVIESDQPLAVVINQTNGRTLWSTAAQPTGSGVISGPLVMSNNAGFESLVQVQNVGTAVTSVTIRAYSSGSGEKRAEQTRTIAAGAATSWPLAPLLGTGERFVGSVTIEASDGGRVIGVVNQTNAASNQGSAYALFSGGTSNVAAPLVQTANSGWNSGFQVQNVGTTEATVTVMVTDTEGRLIESVPDPIRTIQPGKSETWFPISGLATRMVGSAVAVGPAGAQLVGVVNQLNQQSGPVDYFTTYEGINR